MRTVVLQGIRNVRDLGGIPVGGGRQVKPGLLFRGSAPCDATDADSQMLFGKLGITCVIDLRCGWECQAHPTRVPATVERVHVPFYDLEKVGIEYTELAAGTKVVGRDVACDPIRFYRSLANPLTVAQMRQALACAFEHALRGEPVYFHCSGGKDRAGVLAALVLLTLGASIEDIFDDYLITNESRDQDYDRLFQRFLVLADGNEERAQALVASHRAHPQYLAAFFESVEQRYGSMEAFMSQHLDMPERQRERIRQACTCGSPDARRSSVRVEVLPPDARVRLAALEAEAFHRDALHELV